MKIVGIAPYYNVESAHYPYLESIISTMPLVDEMIINDGGCLDGTIPNLQKLRDNVYPNIRFIESFHKKSHVWEGLDEALMDCIKQTDADWIIEVQADEYFHPKDIPSLKKQIKYAHENGYNGIRQRRRHVEWTTLRDGYVHRIIRIFRNLPKVRSFAGGDCFYFEGEKMNHEPYQTHNLPPELESEIDFYHFKGIPMNIKLQARRHKEHYAVNHGNRARLQTDVQLNIINSDGLPETAISNSEIIDEVPELYRGLLDYSKTKYIVRPELFDKEWLRELGYVQ